MQRLSNFSIETDSVVLLHFQDGQEQRVPVSQLPQHLYDSDLKRVNAAMRLRHDFIRTHLPKMGLMVLVILGLAAVVVGGQRAVAQFLHSPANVIPVPPHDTIAHMAAPSTPGISSVPNATTKDRLAPTPTPPSHHALADIAHKQAVVSAIAHKNQLVNGLSVPGVGDISVSASLPALSLPGNGTDIKALPVVGDQALPVLGQNKDQTPVVTPTPETPTIVPATNSDPTPPAPSPVTN